MILIFGRWRANIAFCAVLNSQEWGQDSESGGAILSSAKAVLIGIDGGANCCSPTSSEQRKSDRRKNERKSVAIIQVTQAAMIKGDRSK